jgi:hypothetical protein
LQDRLAQPHHHASDARRLGWALAITATFMLVESVDPAALRLEHAECPDET